MKLINNTINTQQLNVWLPSTVPNDSNRQTETPNQSPTFAIHLRSQTRQLSSHSCFRSRDPSPSLPFPQTFPKTAVTRAAAIATTTAHRAPRRPRPETESFCGGAARLRWRRWGFERVVGVRKREEGWGCVGWWVPLLASGVHFGISGFMGFIHIIFPFK